MPQTNKEIRVTVPGDIDVEDVLATSLIKTLQDAVDKYGPATKVVRDWPMYHDNSVLTFSIVRLETDKERLDRIAHEARQIQAQEDRERKEFLRLSEKFKTQEFP